MSEADEQPAGEGPIGAIDLHSHVLPGLDDGPPDMEGSVALARAAAAAGTRVLAATPHLRSDHPEVQPELIWERTGQLKASLAKAGVELEIVPGAELDLKQAVLSTPELIAGASYGQRGNDVLLETPYGPLPTEFEELVFRHLMLPGFRVTLAHPERSPTFQRAPERLRALVERGVLVQVTAPALVPRRDSQASRLAVALIEQRLAHVLASDAHSAGPMRPPRLDAAVLEAERVAPTRARWMVTDAPAAILAGEPLPPMPAERPPRRLFRRRS